MSEQNIINSNHTHIFEYPQFKDLAEVISKNFNRNVNSSTPLFVVDLKKGELFDTYLNAFPAEHRQHYNCSCCRSFLNRTGGLVTISAEPDSLHHTVSALWNARSEDEVVDNMFNASVIAMRDLVESRPIRRQYRRTDRQLGRFDLEGVQGFHHFIVNYTGAAFFAAHKNAAHRTSAPHELEAKEVELYPKFTKFIHLTSQERVNAVVAFFEHDQQLKHAEQFIDHLKWLKEFRETYSQQKNQTIKRNMIWQAIATQPLGRVSMHNTVLGEFFTNLEEGVSFEMAKAKFLAMVDPRQYLRQTAAPKAGAVKRAEEIFAQLNLGPSLRRRWLAHDEVRGVEWEPQTVVAAEPTKSLFGHLTTKDTAPAEPNLPMINGGVLTWRRFVTEKLPNVTALELVANHHRMYSIVGYSTAADPDAEPILAYDFPERRNPVAGYQYHGGSPLRAWGLTSNTIRIEKIMKAPQDWDEPYNPAEHHLYLLLEGGADTLLSQIPLAYPSLRPGLHEVRGVIEAYFREGKIEPLPEGKRHVVALPMVVDGPIGVDLIATIDGVKVKYTIDRGN